MKEVMDLPFRESAEFIDDYFGRVRHKTAIVLGSGLGGFTNHLSEKKVLRTAEVPGYPHSTVVGHSGEILSAELHGRRIMVFSGRVHYYESVSTVKSAVTAIVSHHLGIRNIVLTNAAGILNQSFDPGDLMLIRDQINLTFRSVLKDLGSLPEKNDGLYSRTLADKMFHAAARAGVNLKAGVYLGLTGPSYETAAEVRMFRLLGGDAVGMSTVHEAAVASSVGMNVAGISCLTNFCTGLTSRVLTHEEVTQIGAGVDEHFSRLLSEFIRLA